MCSILFRLFPIISLFNLIYCFITFLWFLSIEFFVNVAGIFIDENTIFIDENTYFCASTIAVLFVLSSSSICMDVTGASPVVRGNVFPETVLSICASPAATTPALKLTLVVKPKVSCRT